MRAGDEHNPIKRQPQAHLHDVFETADRITVLRLGRDIGVYDRRTTTQQVIVEAITAGVPTKVAGISSSAEAPA